MNNGFEKVKIKTKDEEIWIHRQIVLNLIRTLIIGKDMISYTEIAIHFKKEVIEIKINCNKIELKFENISNEGILCYIAKNNNRNNNIINYINNKKDKSDYLKAREINMIENNNNNLKEDTLNSILEENIILELEQKQQFWTLLLTFKSIISDCVINTYITLK